MKENGNLRNYFLISLITVFALVLFGPFKYTIYSDVGVIYFIFCSILFVIGLSNRKYTISKRVSNYKISFDISKQGIFILALVDILVIISFALFVRSIISTIGSSFSFASEDYRYLLEGRSTLEKLVEAMLHFAAPVFIFFEFSETKFKYRKLYYLSIFTYWLPPLAYLMSGGRWSTFFYLLMFIFIKRRNKRKSKKRMSGAFLKKLIFLVLVFILLASVYSLFTERGYLSIYENYLFKPGDITLRGWAQELINITNGAPITFFKISHYFSESISSFSYLFANYSGQSHLYGLYSFSVLTYLMMPFGYNSNGFKKIVLSYPGAGKYMTFVHGYIVDWGVFFAPLMILITGLLFSKIERSRNTSILCRLLYYYLIVMSIVAPIYNIWGVASVNMDMFFIIVMYLFYKKLGFIHLMRIGVKV